MYFISFFTKVLRAKIRNLEGELASLKATKRGVDREIIQLRTIIDVYIQSKEMSKECWEIMDTHKSGQTNDDELFSVI